MMKMINKDIPVVYTITELDSSNIRVYTKDARVKDGDNDIQIASNNLISMMNIITKLLNDEGLAVVFEVD